MLIDPHHDGPQVQSKQRVSAHGEVFTSPREVNAMLDLVKQETERIDSRFLEPACGNGNFLVEILRRKLSVVEKKYSKSQMEFERYSIVALSSIYGVDIQMDNVQTCRNRLLGIFTHFYKNNAGEFLKTQVITVAEFILSRNILYGDALDLKNPETKEPIVFSEWSFPSGDMIKRRDYMLSYLVDEGHQMALFSDENNPAYIPEPVQEYPVIHYQKLGEDVTDKL